MSAPDLVHQIGSAVSLAVLRRDLRRHLNLLADEAARREVHSFLDRTADEAQDAPPQVSILNDFVRVGVRAGLHTLLASHGIAHPTYNYFESFVDNAPGPWDSTPPTWQASTPPIWRLLGFDISFPVGVPASVLTATADWIEYYARQGFNVLTYKTVRSRERDAHLAPNWIFLKDLDLPFDPQSSISPVRGDTLAWPANPERFSMANSFGVPSFPPDFWQKDIEKAAGCMRSGQLLIVSVMGTYEEYSGPAMIEDFVKVAKMAKAAGAPVIELNLSCPNTIDPATGEIKRAMICESAKDTADIVQAVRGAVGSTPLVVKLSYMSRELLNEVVTPLVQQSLIQGVSGINTVQMPVVQSDHSPAFPGTAAKPEARMNAGVSGIAIQNYGLQFVRWLNEIRKENGMTFDIIGMGGIMNELDVDKYLRAGAQAAQTATAAFFNPDLPKQIYEKLGGRPIPEIQLQARAVILDLLEREGPKPLGEIANELSELYPAERILMQKAQTILSDLEGQGLVIWERQRGTSMFRLERQTEPELEHSR